MSCLFLFNSLASFKTFDDRKRSILYGNSSVVNDCMIINLYKHFGSLCLQVSVSLTIIMLSLPQYLLEYISINCTQAIT